MTCASANVMHPVAAHSQQGVPMGWSHRRVSWEQCWSIRTSRESPRVSQKGLVSPCRSVRASRESPRVSPQGLRESRESSTDCSRTSDRKQRNYEGLMGWISPKPKKVQWEHCESLWVSWELCESLKISWELDAVVEWYMHSSVSAIENIFEYKMI